MTVGNLIFMWDFKSSNAQAIMGMPLTAARNAAV